MNYFVKLDIRNIIANEWIKYNGDINTLDKWLDTPKQKEFIQKVKEHIDQLGLHNATNYKFDKKEREIVIHFEWLEKENVNEWMQSTKEEIKNTIDFYWKKEIIAYTNIIF